MTFFLLCDYQTMSDTFTLSIGSSNCPFSVKQAQANAKNEVLTVFCDAQIDSTKDMGPLDEICHSFRSHEIKDGEGNDLMGVPVNFTCSVPITAENLKDPNLCQVNVGYNPTFGENTLFQQLDSNKDGMLSAEEFRKLN